jgi:translocation and assembly module TamA
MSEPWRPWLRATVLCAGLGLGALRAAETPEIVIQGIDDEPAANVRAFLSLGRTPCDAPAWRLRARFRKARDEIRKALEPFGYYRPHIEQTLTPAAEAGGCWKARFRIDPGPRVHLRRVHVEVEGPAREDPEFRELLARAPLHPGDPLRHDRYEALKRALLNLAQERGFVEARFRSHRLVVDPRAGTADVELVLVSGPRYRFGPTRIEQDVLEAPIVRRFLEYTEGEPYDQKAIDDTQRALVGSGYFNGVMIRPAFEPSPDRRVPITIRLEPAKRNRYAVGIGYATDIGPRFSLEYENRRINRRGHRFRFSALGSPLQSEASLAYLIPHGNPAKENYDLSAGFKHEVTDNTASDIARISAGRSDVLPWEWRQRVFLELSYEDYDVADQADASLLLMAGGIWNRRITDDPVHPTQGHRINLELRGSAGALVSTTRFVQAIGRAKWIHGLGLAGPLVKETRVLLRGDVGATLVDDVTDLPESLRFFAGGDQSVRGFDYKSLGPRNRGGEVFGGRNLVTVGLEVDQYYYEKWGLWGLAAFVDAGNAFNESFEVEVGAGLGLRWRAPIGGTLRLDLAFALTEPGTPWRIHFTMGPDL